jgi:hypothetical protein
MSEPFIEKKIEEEVGEFVDSLPYESKEKWTNFGGGWYDFIEIEKNKLRDSLMTMTKRILRTALEAQKAEIEKKLPGERERIYGDFTQEEFEIVNKEIDYFNACLFQVKQIIKSA